MLISFLGCACSGKTTTAASVFADLKDCGQAVEFIPEQARIYIAALRVNQGLSPGAKLSLDDEDQLAIMEQQHNLEELLRRSCGAAATVLTDSSCINAYFYMGAMRSDPRVKAIISAYLEKKPLMFYVGPVAPGSGQDPNRIHDETFSKGLDEAIPGILRDLGVKPITLCGNTQERLRGALAVIYNRLSEDVP